MTRILRLLVLAIVMVSCQGKITVVEDRPDILPILVGDMDTDLTETRNQAVSHPEIVRDLSGKWNHWADQVRQLFS